MRQNIELTSVVVSRAIQLQEFGSNYESEMLRHQKKLALADVLIFVYDSSDTNSFSYISNLRVSLCAAVRYRLTSASSLTSANPYIATIQPLRHSLSVRRDQVGLGPSSATT